MITKEQLLEQLEQYNPVIKGSKIRIFTTEERSGLLKSLAKSIPGAVYSPPIKAGMSTAGEVQVGSIHIEAKRPKGGGSSGSGAGSYMTDLAESAQCYYNAAAWYGNDFGVETLNKCAKYVNATAGIDEILRTLDDDWIESCIATAKALKAYAGGSKYVFHRGSGLVDAINGNFQTINRKLKEFSNVNKWSPADIWMVTGSVSPGSFNFADFNSLNRFLAEGIRNKVIVGVSLKKAGTTAAVSEVNVDKAHMPSYTYTGASTGKRGFFDSKDVYIFFEGGEIQFRGFPTWQGEIKGKNANHGKVSGGPINNIVRRLSPYSIDQQASVEGSIRAKNKSFYTDFHKMYLKSTSANIKFSEFMMNLEGKDVNWQSSKYLGAQLISIMNTVPAATRQQITSSIINYAKSQSDFSAPFLKVQ
jgi:hypothetical protein